MHATMRTYELLYIIPATLTDEEVAKAETDIQALVQKYGGTPKESRRLGKFRLTYLIKKARHGHYVLAYFDAEPSAVAKINEALRISDSVIRHLILRADEAGGEEFNMVQFQEIVVEGTGRDDRAKRRRMEREKTKTTDDAKAAADLEDKPEEAKEAEVIAPAAAIATNATEPELVKLSAEELDRKIDAALTENT